MSQSKQGPKDNNRGKPTTPDSHITDEFILLSIDDELTGADAEIVSAHLAVCWSCRTRKEQFEESARGVVEYRNARTSPYVPPPQGGPAIFRARLERQAAELGRPSWVARWISHLLYIGKTAGTDRSSWVAAAATAVLLVLVILGIQLIRRQIIPVVSAAELLQKAEQEETRALSVTSKPVVCQRVRIEVNRKSVTRTIYRDPIRKRRAAKVDLNAPQEPSTEKLFRASSFDWDDPLSASRFDSWHAGLAEHRDSVSGVGTSLLTLQTETSQGTVAEASLTVRSSDFHPVSESLELRDSSRIEIAELSYEVVGLEALDPAIFGSPFGIPTAPLRLAIKAATSAPRAPTEMESAAAELEIRAALHRIGADLGEQIEIEETPTRRVFVNALASDNARKKEIQSALAHIPLAELNVRTIAEASAEEQASIPSPNGPGRISARSVESTPLLDKQLRERFSATDARATYVNQSLAMAQNASARAWALRRLADRYTPEELSLLNRESRRRLEELLSDHVGALQQDVSRLRNQLGVVMSTSSNTAAANTTSEGTTHSPNDETQAPTEDWRAEVRRLHSSVETVNECVAVLLGGATSDGEDAEKLELRLRTTLTELQAELETLGHEVQKQI